MFITPGESGPVGRLRDGLDVSIEVAGPGGRDRVGRVGHRADPRAGRTRHPPDLMVESDDIHAPVTRRKSEWISRPSHDPSARAGRIHYGFGEWFPTAIVAIRKQTRSNRSDGG